MKGKNLVILTVAAVILAGAALMTSRDKRPSAPDLMGRHVFPDLPVNEADRIVIYRADKSLTVAKTDDVWISKDRYNYAANFDRIRTLLVKLADLKIGHTVRVEESQKPELRMISPKAAVANNVNKTGILLEIYGNNESLLCSLLIGKPFERKENGEEGLYGIYPDGQYISPDNGKNVYLVSEMFNALPAEPADWLDTSLFNVDSANIKEMMITGPDRKELRLVRNKNNRLELPGLTEKEEIESTKINGIETALSWLKFDDVADPALTDKELGMDKPVIFEAVTKFGETYTVKVGGSTEDKTRHYVKISALLKEPEAPEAAENKAEENLTPENSPKQGEASGKADKRKELELNIKTLNEKLGKWTYLISSYKTDSMTIERSALVKAKEEKIEKKEIKK